MLRILGARYPLAQVRVLPVRVQGEGAAPSLVDALRRFNEADAADVLIIGGTSLTVYPAAGLIDYYRGHKLVLINKSVTPMDNRADLVISGPIGEVLGDAVGV